MSASWQYPPHHYSSSLEVMEQEISE